MEKLRNYSLTIEFLTAYQNAALQNSKELHKESLLLLNDKHYARSYFLAVASIEETGKACIAYHAKGRELNNSGVCKKIKECFENHSEKIRAAFIGWMDISDKSTEAFEDVFDLMIQLQNGREPSMYIDVKDNGIDLSIPSEVVSPIAARNCVEVASKCLHYADEYIKKDNFSKTKSYQDKFMCFKISVIIKLTKMENFWKFYLNEINHGESDWPKAVVKYHDEYFSRKKNFN